jgi:hypothetical protein
LWAALDVPGTLDYLALEFRPVRFRAAVASFCFRS